MSDSEQTNPPPEHQAEPDPVMQALQTTTDRRGFLELAGAAILGPVLKSRLANKVANWREIRIPESAHETGEESTPPENEQSGRKVLAAPTKPPSPVEHTPTEPVQDGWRTQEARKKEKERTEWREQAWKKSQTKKAEPRPTQIVRTATELTQTETFEPVEIAGLETYGAENPLTLDQYNQLVAQLNAEAEENQTEMDQHRHYSTVIVRASEYASIPEATGDGTFQEFVNRHTTKVNEMLAAANAEIPGNETGEQVFRGLTDRHVIVVDNTVDTAYGPSPLTDSDGLTGAWFERGWDPTTDPYWNAEDRISRTWIHEAFHTVFHLPDEYRLNENFALIDSILGPIPAEYRSYWLNNRRDGREETIMNSLHLRLGPFAAWALARRIARGENHQPAASIQETHGFPKEVPNVSFAIDPEEFPTAHHARIGRAQEEATGISLKDTGQSYLIKDGQVNIGDPFPTPDGVPTLNIERSVAVVVIHDKDGQPLAFRLFDAPDTLTADYQAELPFADKLTAPLVPFANPSPWDETYANPINHTVTQHRIYLPLTQRLAAWIKKTFQRNQATTV